MSPEDEDALVNLALENKARLIVLERAFAVLLSRIPELGPVLEAALRKTAEDYAMGESGPRSPEMQRADAAGIRLADQIATEIGNVRALARHRGQSEN